MRAVTVTVAHVCRCTDGQSRTLTPPRLHTWACARSRTRADVRTALRVLDRRPAGRCPPRGAGREHNTCFPRALRRSLRRLGCNAELIVDEFGEKLLEELDYVQEARNILVGGAAAG